jgi:hypothetical protein
MPIQFICPNGHPLSAPSKQSGKPGRCPKCDVAYVTPAADDNRDGVDSPPVVVAADDSDTFEFLCPNGHKIKASGSVAGQKAKCPECGEGFRVPEYPADATEESPLVDQEMGGVEQGAFPEEPPLVDTRGGWGVPENILEGDHGMAEVVAWIWEEKEPGVSVEVCLRDGSVMQAGFYSPSLSSATVGVFAVQGEANQMELTAIQWDAVATVRISCESELVEELLEE